MRVAVLLKGLLLQAVHVRRRLRRWGGILRCNRLLKVWASAPALPQGVCQGCAGLGQEGKLVRRGNRLRVRAIARALLLRPAVIARGRRAALEGRVAENISTAALQGRPIEQQLPRHGWVTRLKGLPAGMPAGHWHLKGGAQLRSSC